MSEGTQPSPRRRRARRKKRPAPPQSRSARQRKQLRRRRIARLVYKLLSLVLIVAASVTALTIFFKVDKVTFIGSTRYSQDALRATLGVAQGDNLIFLNIDKAAQRLHEEYPYLNQVQLKRRLPDTLEVSVTEARPAVALKTGERFALTDKTGKVLEITDAAGAADVARVTGVTLESPAPGDRLLDKDPGDQLTALFTLVNELAQWDMLTDADFINVSVLYDVRLGYEERFDIRLGEVAQLDQKLRFLEYLLAEKLSPTDLYVVDLADVAKVRTRVTTQEELARSEEPIVVLPTAPTLPDDGDGQD